jgi:hypothetical protein
VSQTDDRFVTCPVGHTFPKEQLTIRDGQHICPICDQIQWATPCPQKTWTRLALLDSDVHFGRVPQLTPTLHESS